MFDHLTITDSWDGNGLPPIGERVGTSLLHPIGDYEPAIIVAHVPRAGELIAVFVLEDGCDWSWSSYGIDDGDCCSFVPWRQVSSGRA
jgi:hypothetical protein